MQRDLDKYNQSLILRESGKSIRAIAKLLKISSSTASIWCRNVQLTEIQKNHLNAKGQNAKLLRHYAAQRHLDKIQRHQIISEEAKTKLFLNSKDQLFIAGIALYWAEGFKNIDEGRIGFCNSDPKMIKFMINWFKKILKVSNSDFILRTEFNNAHKSRQEEIESYWSKTTKIPLSQFNSPYLQQSKHLRDYSKRGKYYGVLRIRVRKSSELLVKIRAWIEMLSKFSGKKVSSNPPSWG